MWGRTGECADALNAVEGEALGPSAEHLDLRLLLELLRAPLRVMLVHLAHQLQKLHLTPLEAQQRVRRGRLSARAPLQRLVRCIAGRTGRRGRRVLWKRAVTARAAARAVHARQRHERRARERHRLAARGRARLRLRAARFPRAARRCLRRQTRPPTAAQIGTRRRLCGRETRFGARRPRVLYKVYIVFIIIIN